MEFYFRKTEQQVRRPKDRKKAWITQALKRRSMWLVIECKEDENKFVEVEEANIMGDLGCIFD